ncbi:GNAT family N-acetyltransferase [Candidatus Halobonum tyrrellensis]|uniref:Acetyltransferase n=1 Tax=Candidatus Halobonum tyrrellensis G22 TaxID=1324957 RepID=V4HGR3_9EURY|nr:GNAT family N-acetyltransferase [Candidatus Halobonum tyrrellensis]ESP89880.1 acetyltransferase [Candidatus Halobonum tyrrellensis G22]
MEIRTATTDDVVGIREVARASLDASYGHVLSADLIDDAVESWYDADGLADDLADDDAVFLVAADDGDAVGFVQAYYVDGERPTGTIDWLHVAPDARGRGTGTDLLGRAETDLLDRGVDRIEGRVLVANESGTGFYEEEGFERTREREVDIGGEAFRERTYTKLPGGDGRPATETRTGDDGTTVYVAYDEGQRASLAPFYATYLDTDRTERYGYACGNCESLTVSVDSMDRVQCESCDNRRKPTRWDAAYL